MPEVNDKPKESHGKKFFMEEAKKKHVKISRINKYIIKGEKRGK